jgi:probable addiction module antidote protein
VVGIKVLKSKIYERLRNIGRTMRDSKTAKSVSYHPYLIESLKDLEEAAAYIEAALEEGEPKLLQLVLTNVAEAYKEMNTFSEQAIVHHEKLDKLLSEDRDSEIYSLVALLDALGFKLAIAPK